MTVSAALEAELRPDPTVYATWYAPSTTSNEIVSLAANLLFGANLFRHGLLGTLYLTVLNDDPHAAFTGMPPPATQTANDLTSILDAFYVELAGAVDPSCTHRGEPISLADNTALVVTGDTPKNSFDANGWNDATPGNANWIYVRSNGWLVPGWFGQITSSAKTTFDPQDGALRSGFDAPDIAAACDALLYAITRGDAAFVAKWDQTAFPGLVSTTAP